MYQRLFVLLSGHLSFAQRVYDLNVLSTYTRTTRLKFNVCVDSCIEQRQLLPTKSNTLRNAS